MSVGLCLDVTDLHWIAGEGDPGRAGKELLEVRERGGYFAGKHRETRSFELRSFVHFFARSFSFVFVFFINSLTSSSGATSLYIHSHPQEHDIICMDCLLLLLLSCFFFFVVFCFVCCVLFSSSRLDFGSCALGSADRRERETSSLLLFFY